MYKIAILLVLVALSGCKQASKVPSSYNREFTYTHSQSQPIHLKIRNPQSKKIPFYFLLSSNSKTQDYKLTIRWKSPSKKLLFNGYDSTVTFFIDQSEFITLKPISIPTIISYNMNSLGHTEEGVFLLTQEDFLKIISAKSSVSVELSGRDHIAYGEFNKTDTMRGFKNFADQNL